VGIISHLFVFEGAFNIFEEYYGKNVAERLRA
jgi:hypothetical protein